MIEKYFNSTLIFFVLLTSSYCNRLNVLFRMTMSTKVYNAFEFIDVSY